MTGSRPKLGRAVTKFGQISDVSKSLELWNSRILKKDSWQKHDRVMGDRPLRSGQVAGMPIGGHGIGHVIWPGSVLPGSLTKCWYIQGSTPCLEWQMLLPLMILKCQSETNSLSRHLITHDSFQFRPQFPRRARTIFPPAFAWPCIVGLNLLGLVVYNGWGPVRISTLCGRITAKFTFTLRNPKVVLCNYHGAFGIRCFE